MAFMDMFKPAANTQSINLTPNVNNPAGNMQANPPTNTGTNNPAVGTDGKMPGSNQAPANPLDEYAKMFDNATKSEEAPVFAIDPKVLGNVAGTLDFTSGLDPALMARVNAGNDPAALVELVKKVGQAAYQASLHHTTTLTDKFITARSAYDAKGFGSKVKSQLTTQALSEAPNYSHPVVRQQLNEVATRMQAQHPDASPQEIAQAAQKYIQDLAAALNPSAKASTQEGTLSDGNVDWASYLG